MMLPTGPFLLVPACSLAAVVLTMVVSFAIGSFTGKYSVVDAIWGPGFVVIAVVAFVVSAGYGDETVRWLFFETVGEST